MCGKKAKVPVGTPPFYLLCYNQKVILLLFTVSISGNLIFVNIPSSPFLYHPLPFRTPSERPLSPAPGNAWLDTEEHPLRHRGRARSPVPEKTYLSPFRQNVNIFVSAYESSLAPSCAGGGFFLLFYRSFASIKIKNKINTVKICRRDEVYRPYFCIRNDCAR